MITIINNMGYKWCSAGKVHFKGYFFKLNNLKLFKGHDALTEIKNIDNAVKFKDFLKNINGIYSIIIDLEDQTLIAVDRSRSFPIYYSVDGQQISDSAEEIRDKIGVNTTDVDLDNMVELYANYYLFGHKTVYREIKQLDLGEYGQITKDGIKTERYYWHLNNVSEGSISDMRKRINIAAENTFKRIHTAIGNRPVVLSMSGGYDSRFVGCMLRNMGVKDVSCYTYGKANSFEVIQSKKNAEALGFRWTCVEMTDELVARNLDSVGQAYFDSYNGHDFTAYMQNFTAVRKLHEDGWFKPGSVFLTGLCGDMPTGEYAVEYNPDMVYNIDTAASRIYDLVFTRFKVPSEIKTKWLTEMKNLLHLLPIKIKDYQTWVLAVDCIYTGTCHSHWYMHMNTVHSFFGYEWLLPYWDVELLNAWYTIPSKYKVGQTFYEDWLMDEIFKAYGLDQRKYIGGYSKRNVYKRKIQYMIGGCINYILLHLGLPFKRKYDFSNFAPFELELFKNIKTRSCINYKRSGMMQLLDQYLVEKRYGTEVLKYVCSKTKSKE